MEKFVTNASVQVAIDGDTERVISFNPKDRMFRNRILQYAHEMTGSLAQYQRQFSEMSVSEEKDDYGFPVNAKEILDTERTIAEAFRDDFDRVFGAGSADKLFGMGGFDESILAEFLSFVIDKVNVIGTKKIEEKLGKPVRAPGKAKV